MAREHSREITWSRSDKNVFKLVLVFFVFMVGWVTYFESVEVPTLVKKAYDDATKLWAPEWNRPAKVEEVSAYTVEAWIGRDHEQVVLQTTQPYSMTLRLSSGKEVLISPGDANEIIELPSVKIGDEVFVSVDPRASNTTDSMDYVRVYTPKEWARRISAIPELHTATYLDALAKQHFQLKA